MNFTKNEDVWLTHEENTQSAFKIVKMASPRNKSIKANSQIAQILRSQAMER